MNLINFTEAVGNISGDKANNRTLLISSLNMALTELHLRIPIIKRVKCNIKSMVPTLYYPQIDCNDGRPITLPLQGKTYSMRLLGRGNYCIRDGESVTAAQFNAGIDGQILRGFIYSGGTIELWGGIAFSVCNFAVYNQVSSVEEEDIPIFSPTRKLNLRNNFNDFLAFASPVTDANGKVIKNCLLSNGEMEIDSTYNGEVIISYRCTHPSISFLDPQNDMLKTIEVPREYENLLLYLTAHFYWSSESESMSKFFRERFDDLVALVDKTYRCIDYSYTDVNGWA